MSGPHSFQKLRARMAPERRARNAARTRDLIAEMSLHELRQARAQSQADLAKRLRIRQPAIAKMERHADMYVGTLRRFIEEMGGTLEVVAHFPEGSVTITNFSEAGAEPGSGLGQSTEYFFGDMAVISTLLSYISIRIYIHRRQRGESDD